MQFPILYSLFFYSSYNYCYVLFLLIKEYALLVTFLLAWLLASFLLNLLSLLTH